MVNKTFDDIRIDLVHLSEKMDKYCESIHNCENCPFRINGRDDEPSCWKDILNMDLDYFADNCNDIRGNIMDCLPYFINEEN